MLGNGKVCGFDPQTSPPISAFGAADFTMHGLPSGLSTSPTVWSESHGNVTLTMSLFNATAQDEAVEEYGQHVSLMPGGVLNLRHVGVASTPAFSNFSVFADVIVPKRLPSLGREPGSEVR